MSDYVHQPVPAPAPAPALERRGGDGVRSTPGRTLPPERRGQPPAAAAALAEPGRPLDLEMRFEMEAAFGHSFERVQVHSGPGATAAARSLDALAFAVGDAIVFGADRYRPQSGEGRRLLAHELAHVAGPGDAARSEHEADRLAGQALAGQAEVGEVSAPAAPAVQRKRGKAEPAPPFYQQAVDRLREEERQYIPIYSIAALRKLVQLGEAIDQERTNEVAERLEAFLAADTERLPLTIPDDALVNTLISRLLLMGLDKESTRFRRWFLEHERKRDRPQGLTRQYLSEIFIWEQVLEKLVAPVPGQRAEGAVRSLDALLTLFGQLRDELAGLDKEELKRDAKRRAASAGLDTFGGLRLSDNGILTYQARLVDLLRQTFQGVQAALQIIMDRAAADLEAGKGSAFLQLARDRLEGRMAGLIEPREEAKRVTGVTTEITRSRFEKGGGKHLDVFAQGKAAERRSVGVTFYDEQMEGYSAAEKELSFGQIFLARRAQIALLEELYGLAKEKGGKPRAESKENAALMAGLGKGGLRLHSNDDWRAFLLAKFEARRARVGKAEALTATIRLLEQYLGAFTTHTPYNIEDFGDNYLSRTFPRALTGQLIHDCGVYALRIAYMLSQVREHKDLQLRFRFVMLPVHVALVITGDGLPTYVANNDRIAVYPAAVIADLQREWDRAGAPGEAERTPGAKGAPEAQDAPRRPLGAKERAGREAQFVGELAAAEFLPATAVPYKVIDVPRAPAGDAAARQKLWRFYRDAVRTELFSHETQDPKSPHYQFHLRYLDVLERIRVHHKEHLMPFWNGAARKQWASFEPRLKAAHGQIQAAKPGTPERKEAQRTYTDLASRYSAAVDKALEPAQKAYSEIIVIQVELVGLC